MEAVKMKERMLVSVVLPVYNQATTIRRCLETIANQTSSPKEIIVVDDGSTDQTSAHLREFSKSNTIRVMQIPHSGRSSARNLGANNAQGTIIAFAEGDAEYDPTYLAEGLKFFADPKIGAAYIQHQAYHRKGWIAEAVWLEREIAFQGYEPFSAWFYRKKIFTDLGGFDESLECAEDQDLARRLRKEGWMIGFEPRVLWWHREPDSLLKVIRRSCWRGRHKVAFYRKYPKDVPIKKLLLTSMGTVLLVLALNWKYLLVILGILLLALFSGKTYTISHKGWNIARKRRYLVLISALSIVRNAASSLGTLVGFLEHFLASPDK